MKGKLISGLLSALIMIGFTLSGFVAAGAYPDDPYLGNWQFAKVGIDATWNAVNTENEIVVAVLDTGLDVELPDFAGRIAPGYDYIRDTSAMIDSDGHGTLISSAIAALANNGIGIAGAAGTANVKIAPYRIGEGGQLDNDSIHDALIAAADREEIRIINLSFGSFEIIESQLEAISYAQSRGKIIIAGSGNHGAATRNPDPYYYPASYPGVISVGSVGLNGEIASFSQVNDAVDLYAPGESLLLMYPDARYGWQDGTSFSAAIVSGIAAALLAQDPGLTAAEIETILKETAVPFGEAGEPGLVQADAALEAVKKQRPFAYALEQLWTALNAMKPAK